MCVNNIYYIRFSLGFHSGVWSARKFNSLLIISIIVIVNISIIPCVTRIQFVILLKFFFGKKKKTRQYLYYCDTVDRRWLKLHNKTLKMIIRQK